jgi:hypothetical protein
VIAEGHGGAVLRRLDEVTELRLLDEDDADALFVLTLANRDYLRRWFNWLDDLGTADDTRRRISRSKDRAPERRRAQGRHLAPRQTDRKALMGYWLAEEH